ncbi:MAG: IS110 family transposase [Candidatus Kariarchaeaceae archaeon]|jgi:transposase
MYYSGIDLHKDMSFITTINDTGMIVKQSKVSNNDFAILNYFNSIGSDHQTVVESTSNWYWLSDLLKDHQIRFTLAHAKYLKAISYAKVKTDKVDSHTLAQLLRMNLIPVAHQISQENRGLQDMMRARLRLVHKKTSCLNSIHRLLEKFNISVPDNRNLHDLSTLDHLNDLPLSAEYQFPLNALSEQIR